MTEGLGTAGQATRRDTAAATAARTARSSRLRAGGTLVARAGGLGIQLLLSVAIGRVLGAEGAGLYFLFVSWASLLGVVAAFGYPLTVLRSSARLFAAGEADRSRRELLESISASLLVGGGVALAAALVARPLAASTYGGPGIDRVVILAGIAAVPFAATRLVSSALKGHDRPSLGLTVEYALLPVFLLVQVAVTLLTGNRLSAGAIMAGYVVAATLAAVAGAAAVFDGPVARGAALRLGRLRGQLRSQLPFLGLTLLSSAFSVAPFLMLPLYGSPAEIGQFGVAVRLTMIPASILIGLASWFAPRFARCYANGDRAALVRVFRQSQLYATLGYLPFLAVYLAAPGPVLGLFWPEFRGGVAYLWIMAAAQLFNSAAGLVGYLLNMCGRERWELGSLAASMAAMVAMGVLLGSRHGALGLAVAFGLAVIVKNLISWTLVRKTFSSMENTR